MGQRSCTRKTVNVNILQTQFHSCFCVQAKHNSSWPSFTTTGRLRDCFLFALFFWTGDQSVRFLQCFLFTATVQRAADRPEETACTLRRGTCCSTAETSTSALSLYFLAFAAHTEWTRGKRLWLGSQYFAVEFKGIPNSNNSRTPGGLRCGLTRNTIIDKNNLLNSFTGTKSRLLWWTHLLVHACTHRTLQSTKL